MNRLRPHSVGLTLGTFLALWHTLWATLVWAGAAQPVIDFIFRLHMIEPPYKIAGFDPALALGLILVTAAIGYVFGSAAAVIWNRYAAGPAKLPRIDASSI
jgi:hypothetical protein